jgi:putative flippase GtrA
MKVAFFQILRYAIVGLLSNAVGYCLYLLLTNAGMGYKLAMTLLYVVGTLQTFVFNKNWSFKYKQRDRTVLLRYLTTYALGYIANLAVLMVFVDSMHLPHAVVQAVMIFVIALLVFLLQKFWVFPARTNQSTCPESAL